MPVQEVILLNQNTPTVITGGFVPKGAYNGATDYAVGDSVDYNGSSYVMFVDAVAGTLPTDTTKWQVVANKGATGSTGATGDTGPAGADGVVQTVVAGTGISVDSTDPANPVVTATAGGGDVSKVGTPVNNQIGVWTGDGTIEGDAALTFDTATDTLTTGTLNATSLTASEIAGTDASKNVVSLPVATYPSLAELAHVKGVTSALQTQIDGKQATITGLTASGAELNILDGATLTTAELNYVDGVTSAIQTQIDTKLASASYTAADVLSKLLTVDGAGSGIDADLLDGNSSAAFATSAQGTTADNALPKAGGTMTGNITLSENTSVALDPAGSADGKYSGITVTGTAGYTQAFGDVVYLDPTDSRWEATDANAAASADGDARGLLGMVVVAGTDGNPCTILLEGIIRADANFPALTIGAPVYVAETAGDIVVAQPTTTDAVIRIVGSALTADEIFFRPDFSFITHT